MDRRSSRHSLGDTSCHRPSASGPLSSSARELHWRSGSMDGRSSRPHAPARGEATNFKSYRAPEADVASVRANVRRTTNPFAYPEESGRSSFVACMSAMQFSVVTEYADCSPLDVATTLSSLTSNATSEVSSHRTDRSDLHPRKTDKHHNNRRKLMHVLARLCQAHG